MDATLLTLLADKEHPEKLVSWMEENAILVPQAKICDCKKGQDTRKEMRLEPSKSNPDGFVFRCTFKNCRKKKSIRSCSTFSKSKIDLRAYFYATTLWDQHPDWTYQQICNKTQMDLQKPKLTKHVIRSYILRWKLEKRENEVTKYTPEEIQKYGDYYAQLELHMAKWKVCVHTAMQKSIDTNALFPKTMKKRKGNPTLSEEDQTATRASHILPFPADEISTFLIKLGIGFLIPEEEKEVNRPPEHQQLNLSDLIWNSLPPYLRRMRSVKRIEKFVLSLSKQWCQRFPMGMEILEDL